MSRRCIFPVEAMKALRLHTLLSGFLCKLTENIYGVEFLEFEVKDYDSGRSVFKVCLWGTRPTRVLGFPFSTSWMRLHLVVRRLRLSSSVATCGVLLGRRLKRGRCLVVSQVVKDPQQPSLLQLAESLPPELENAVRTIKYTFPEEFLRYKIVRTSCVPACWRFACLRCHCPSEWGAQVQCAGNVQPCSALTTPRASSVARAPLRDAPALLRLLRAPLGGCPVAVSRRRSFPWHYSAGWY